MRKKLSLFLVLFSIFILFFLLESCTGFVFSRKYKSEKEIIQYIDKYPLIAFLYLNKIDIRKGFLTIKSKQGNLPLFLISGKIIFFDLIQLDGKTQLGTNFVNVFDLQYSFESHQGYFEDLVSKLKYNISSESLNIPKSIFSYIEKNFFLILLMLKGNQLQNIKNGEIEIEDIVFSIKDFQIEKAEVRSQTIQLKVYYNKYKKWEKIYYPSIINLIFKDFDVNLLLTNVNLYLSF